MEFLTCDGCEDEYNKQLRQSLGLQCTLVHKPLPSIETLISRNDKEVSEISQVYLRAG